MYSTLLSVVGFLIILGPLVIIHEFGHFIFARLFGVKAEIFSVGFGPRLWARKIGETEWRVSAVPMGGYVKLLGEDRESEVSAEELKRALHKQAPWKRFFIFFGGPLFNFLFAIVIFMAILAIGEPQVASVVGRVVHHSQAEKAGFVSGDRILSIDGQKVERFEEVFNILGEKPNQTVSFEIQHPGASAPVTIQTQTTSQSGFSVYGEQKPVGDVDGLLPYGRGNQVGISDPASAAGRAGLRTGDQLIAFNDSPVDSWEKLETLYARATPAEPVRLKVKRSAAAVAADTAASDASLKPGANPAEFVVTLTKPNAEGGMGQAWGLRSSELFVEKPVDKSPAAEAGLKHGDRLVGIGPNDVYSFLDLREAVQKSGEKTGKVMIRWERDGKEMSADVKPTVTEGRDPTMKKTQAFTVGVIPMASFAEPVTVITRILNPFMLVYKGAERMAVLSYRNFVSIGKMFTGDVSVGTLGGPILIGKIAGESLTHGLIAFLSTMGLLSIGLGVLNVLPVPVLDGGHLLLLGVEAIRRKPLTVRQMEIVQSVGLVLILALMGVVLKNDISRLAFF